MVPLRTKLKSGDRIEVLTDKRRTPNREWLDFVVTSRARTRIRAAVRKREHEQAREVGSNLLDRALRASGSTLSKLEDSSDRDVVIQKLRQNSFDELLAQIGLNKITTDAVVQLLYPAEPTLRRKRSRSQRSAWLSDFLVASESRARARNRRSSSGSRRRLYHLRQLLLAASWRADRRSRQHRTRRACPPTQLQRAPQRRPSASSRGPLAHRQRDAAPSAPARDHRR